MNNGYHHHTPIGVYSYEPLTGAGIKNNDHRHRGKPLC